MFVRTTPVGPETVTIHFEGRDLVAAKGESVAAALLSAGITHFRHTPVTGSPRGPFCMMGVCFDCLLRIDGEADQQACIVPVRDGMRIARHSGKADALENLADAQAES